MKDFIAKITLPALFVLAIFSASAAGKVTFEAHSPLKVATGEQFQVQFVVNAEPDGDSFKAPSFEGFDVLAGPAMATGQSRVSVNGVVTRNFQCVITYVLLAGDQPGNITVGAAEIGVEGTSYSTKPLPIEVIAEHSGGGSGGDSGRSAEESAQPETRNLQGQIAKDDVLLRAIVSQTSVFKGEPLRVTFKLYERATVVGYDGVKFPSFNGFWAQELNTDNARRQRETYNGKVYETLVAREFLLYPQQAGALTIDPAELTAMVQVMVESRRNSNPFLGGSHEVYNVPRKVQTQKVTVLVKELPAGAPASFNGAVGRFSMDAVLPSDRLAANSSATYTIRIAGMGNLTFVQAPKLTLPGSFEQYNVKTTESINTTSEGISGYRQFEYPFIARAEGTYDIAPVEFCYFDPGRMQYTVLSSKPLTLEITPDAQGGNGEAYMVQGRGMSKEEVKMLGETIRFIKLGNAQLRSTSEPFVFSMTYWLLLVGILLLFTVVYVALRKQIRDSQNVALVRGKRASKVAVQRFRIARKYMDQQDRHAFYEEMLRALWGYMSDKFNIPVANLTKENVREELHKRGVSAEASQRFTSIITKCDEAQYSPAASAQMTDVYGEGLDLISHIESVIKR